MRYVSVMAGIAIALSGLSTWADTPGEDETAPPKIVVAQASEEANVSSSASNSIFEGLNIELTDLRELVRKLDENSSLISYRMTLDEVIRLALEANPDIIIAYDGPIMASADVVAARGEFDPLLSGSFSHTDSRASASGQVQIFSGFSDTESKVTDYRVRLGGKFYNGTQYNVEVGTNRNKGTFTRSVVIDPTTGLPLVDPITGFPVTNVDSEYSSATTFTLTQPFLRGNGKRVNLARIRTARNFLGISEQQTRQTVMTMVGEAQKAYWDLVGAIEVLAVRDDALANAKRVLDISEKRLRFEVGTPLEVFQAKAGVATAQGEFVSARALISAMEDNLKLILGMRDDGLFDSARIIPVESPQVILGEWDMKESMERALSNRPEIVIANLDIENAEIEEYRAKNDRLPQLDGSLSYTQSGLDFDFDGSYTNLRNKQGRTWVYGVSGSIPLGNRAAKGAHLRAKQQIRQTKHRRFKAEQDVMLAVRTAMRGVITNEILVKNSEQARILQQANVAAEEKRLELGVTTSHEVLQVQENLTAARDLELQNKINFEKSLVDLKVAEGVVLRELGIEFEDSE